MARMYPDHIPQAVRDNPALDAEATVYESLRDGLSDEWMVCAWASWVHKKRDAGAAQGEADFILAHPEHGIVVLEVKGGIIAYDASSFAWTSTSMGETSHPIQDPIQQASRNRHHIERKLREVPNGLAQGVGFGYAVVFPDCALPDGVVRAYAPRDILLPYGDLSRIGERIAEVVAYWRRPDGRVALGADGIACVTRVFANSFQMRMPLGRAIAADARRVIELTERQFGVLDGLARNRRMVVTGGAGTGKTLLAVEKATRLARDHGFRTLLTCFNRPLADHLRASVGEVAGLDVLNFHELCADVARAAGHDVPDLADPSLSNGFFRETLPGLLVDAMTTIGRRYEAIVVDEGQDFSPTDRAALELVLEDRDDTVLYVFQDETQAIYRDARPWPERGMASFELTENRRNTRAIHEVLARLSGDTRTRPLGPEGRSPEYVLAERPAEQGRELSRVLHRLIRDESVPPSAIAVLVSSRRAVPDLVTNGRIGAFGVTTRHDDERELVLVESVTRFKGLERDVIVLVRIEPVDYCAFDPMLYVGASRARAQLVVIGAPELIARFQGTERPVTA